MKKFFLVFFFLFFNRVSFCDLAVVEEKFPVIILGGGVGALTSATYLARAGISPLVITGPIVGGTITMSHDVQNWPGEIAISGDLLSEKLYKQAEANGALLRGEVVVAVDLSKRPFTITTNPLFSQEIKKYKADACIIALGSTPNLLHIPGEEKFWTKGVYNCAVCDGTLYKDKIVAVVGGGDSALAEAHYLSNLAKHVYLIVRGSQIQTVEKKRAQEILSLAHIEVLYETSVEEIKGEEDKITHLLVYNKRDQKHTQIPVNALFLAIGSQPNSQLFANQLELDEKGYIQLKKHQQTSIEGVFAIGDIADPEFKQAISAAGDGAKAALQTQKFLSTLSQANQLPASVKEKKQIIEITSRSQFEEHLKGANSVVFVDFYSSHCAPCRSFKPVFESWARDFQDRILFLQVNAEVAGELFNLYGVRFVPTLAIFDSQGNLLRKNSGPEIAAIEKFLRQYKDKQQIQPQDFD